MYDCAREQGVTKVTHHTFAWTMATLDSNAETKTLSGDATLAFLPLNMRVGVGRHVWSLGQETCIDLVQCIAQSKGENGRQIVTLRVTSASHSAPVAVQQCTAHCWGCWQSYD